MCNLAGYNGSQKANLNIIKLLSVFGTTRGTDGYGAWLGSRLYKYGGYNGEGNALNVIHGKIVKFDQGKSNTILLHNRAKSVGYVNKDNAHPYEYDYIEGQHLVFAHNGTIKNIDELCDKYKIPSKIGATDSYYLGQIIYENGFDVLKEYYGFAALTVLDVNTDILYIWKGFSQCESTKPTEERPLHIYKGKGFIYYNSEEIGLVTALNTDKNITEVPDNTLLAYKNGELIDSTKYDRSHIQYKIPTYAGYAGTNNSSALPAKTNTNTNSNISLLDYYQIERCPQNISGKRIYCWQAKYWQTGHILDGIYCVHTDGYAYKATPDQIASFEEYSEYVDYTIKYFWKGYMLRSEFIYNELIERQIMAPSFFSSYGFAQKLHDDTVYLAKHTNGYSLFFNRAYADNKYCTPLFSDFSYKIEKLQVIVKEVVDLVNAYEETDIVSKSYPSKKENDSDNAYTAALDLFEGGNF